jgi:hypothetical protein
MLEWSCGRSEQRILVRPSDLDRSRRFYRDVLGLAVYRKFGPPDDPGVVFCILRGPAAEPCGLIEMRIADPDGIRIVLVEVPADHPLHRDRRSASPQR